MWTDLKIGPSFKYVSYYICRYFILNSSFFKIRRNIIYELFYSKAFELLRWQYLRLYFIFIFFLNDHRKFWDTIHVPVQLLNGQLTEDLLLEKWVKSITLPTLLLPFKLQNLTKIVYFKILQSVRRHKKIKHYKS